MHYTGMAALQLRPMAGAMIHAGAPPIVLGAGVAGATLLILAMALLASLYDQRLNVLAALEAGGVGYWELALPGMALQVSPKAKELLGRPAGVPFGLPELSALLAAEDEARLVTDIQAAIAARTEYQAEQLVTLADGSEKWVNVRGRVVAETAAGPSLMVGVVFDVTERQLAFAAVAASERRQRRLVDELNHRVKNTLATVQSIARQSAKRAESWDEFVELFEARLMALSLTHNALTRGGWETAGLVELLRQELGPYPQEQVRLEGEDVALLPREALAMAMVFHELATNAAKYGALSTPHGCVDVRWGATRGLGGFRLSLDWIERDGPRVTPPTRRGFGSRLVEGSVAGELGGSAELEFAETGFRARLSVPLGRAQNDEAA
jgi:PAS domain S-box-containing protein